VAAFLADPACRDREIVVRVNSRDSGLLLADLLAIGPGRPDIVNVPKVESVRDLQFADDVLSHLEQEHQIPARSIRLMPTLESARGVRLATELCQASDRVVALQFGMGDLKASTGITSRPDVLRSIRLQLVLAAAECGIDALDSAYPDFSDSAGFSHDCNEARALVFRGKSCIHPAQVEACNACFLPSANEVEEARALIQAYEEARSAGTGAINSYSGTAGRYQGLANALGLKTAAVPRAAPGFGEHTHQVLIEHGLTDEEIQALGISGVLGASPSAA
jgi:citrate lyase subunit beta/citryl-CoA lyase